MCCSSELMGYTELRRTTCFSTVTAIPCVLGWFWQHNTQSLSFRQKDSFGPYHPPQLEGDTFAYKIIHTKLCWSESSDIIKLKSGGPIAFSKVLLVLFKTVPLFFNPTLYTKSQTSPPTMRHFYVRKTLAKRKRLVEEQSLEFNHSVLRQSACQRQSG